MVAVTAAYGAWTLHANGTSDLYVTLVAVVGALALGGLLLRWVGGRRPRHLLPAVALVAALAVALPLGTWGARTAATAHSGSIPDAVSTSASGQSGGAQTGGQGAPSGTTKPTGTAPSGTRPSGAGDGQGGGASTSAALTKALKASTTTWSAATVGAQSAASLELASNTSVIAIGGFSGSDQAPTLAQFKAWVAAGKIHYFVAGGQGGGAGGNSGVASQITSWVKANFTATTIGGTTVYDLTS